MRNPYLDILRCLAISSVVVFHYEGEMSFLPEILVRAQKHLWIGVDLFFVISGFLIGDQWLKALKRNDPKPFSNFYVKRIFRILPSYLLVLGIYLSHSILVMKRSVPIWKFLIFAQNFGLPPLFVQSWSLCVEEHFYILFPALSFLVLKFSSPKTLTKALAGLFFAPLFLRLYLMTTIAGLTDHNLLDPIFYYPTYVHFEGIILGVFIAHARMHLHLFTTMKSYQGPILIVSASILALTWFLLGHLGNSFKYTIAFTLLAVAFGGLTVFSIQAQATQKVWVRPFTFISELSFSLYLLFHLNQLGFTVVLNKSGLQLPAAVQFVLVNASLVFFSWVLFSFWEKPWHRLRTRFLERESRLTPA